MARALLCTAIALASSFQIVHRGNAQVYPSRPITMVVPFAAGGAVDVLGRIMAQRLGEILGQQVVIENVTGAGGMTGTNRVARAVPDGYQFVLGGVGTFAYSQALYKKPLYNSMTDFTPVGLITEEPLLLLTRNEFPAKDIQGFVEYAKTNQAKLQFGSAGAGSGGHLSCALLNAAAAINITHIPYRGGAPAMQDLLAGRIDYMCANVSFALSQIQGNAVKAIAILGHDRSSVLPKVLTVQEQGLGDLDAAVWNGFFVPKGTSEAVVRRLLEASSDTLNTQSVRRRLAELGLNIVPPDRRSPEYLAKFLPNEIEKWTAVIKAIGLSPD